MIKYEKLTVIVRGDPDGPSDELTEYTYKNATYMFDQVYTSIVTKKKDVTFKTDDVLKIIGEGKIEE